MATIARNAPCPCGSGKKYKKCCLGTSRHPHSAFGKALPVGTASDAQMLDRRMQQGYRFMMTGQTAQACDRWTEVWEIIRPRLRPEMRTCESTTVVFDGSQPLHDWLQDFALELYNAALDDARCVDTGIQLCEKVISQFPDETELFRLNFRADLGQFYYMAKRDEQGERVLLDMIRDYPDHAAGYARLADILTFGVHDNDDPIDLPRAKSVLQEALSRPVNEAAEYDLKARLDDLLNDAQQPAGSDPTPIP